MSKAIAVYMFRTHRSVYCSIPLMAVFVSLYALLGVTMFAHFEFCDPIVLGAVSNRDQVSKPLLHTQLLGVKSRRGIYKSIFSVYNVA